MPWQVAESFFNISLPSNLIKVTWHWQFTSEWLYDQSHLFYLDFLGKSCRAWVGLRYAQQVKRITNLKLVSRLEPVWGLPCSLVPWRLARNLGALFGALLPRAHISYSDSAPAATCSVYMAQWYYLGVSSLSSGVQCPGCFHKFCIVCATYYTQYPSAQTEQFVCV